MIIQIGFRHAELNIRRGFVKEVKSEEAADAVGKFIFEAANNGWVPTYVLVDGIEKLRKLDHDAIEIVIP